MLLRRRFLFSVATALLAFRPSIAGSPAVSTCEAEVDRELMCATPVSLLQTDYNVNLPALRPRPAARFHNVSLVVDHLGDASTALSNSTGDELVSKVHTPPTGDTVVIGSETDSVTWEDAETSPAAMRSQEVTASGVALAAANFGAGTIPGAASVVEIEHQQQAQTGGQAMSFMDYMKWKAGIAGRASNSAFLWCFVLVLLLVVLLFFLALSQESFPSEEKSLMQSWFERKPVAGPTADQGRRSDPNSPRASPLVAVRGGLGSPIPGPSSAARSPQPKQASFGQRGSPQASANVGPPPVLCPSLLLPRTEARFMVSLEVLTKPRWGSFDIMGTTGRKLLDGSLAGGGGNFLLKVASAGREDEPRAIVEARRGASTKLYSATDVLFGTIEPKTDGGGYLLVCNGVHSMNLEVARPDCLEATASAMDGQPLASAELANGNMWRLQVKPGADAVLIMSCLLSLIFSRSLHATPSTGSPLTAPTFPGMAQL